MSKIVKTKEAFGWIDGYLSAAQGERSPVTIPALTISESVAEWVLFETNYGTTGSLLKALNDVWFQSSGAYEVPLTFSESLSRAVNTVTLTNDSASPGHLKDYGTDAAGTRGWVNPFAGATLPVPTGFAWTSPGFDILRAPAGYRTTIPWTAFKPTTATKIRYVDIATGSNSDPGDTWGNAWKGIGYALTQAAADPAITLIYVKAGRYSFGDNWDNTNVNHALAVVADGGTVISSGGILASSIAWAPDGTYPNVYVGTRSASSFVVDHATLTADGNGTHLTSQSSVADVDANPGSFFVSGSSVYVRTVDSRAPDVDVEIIMAVNGPTMNGANNYYVEGFDFRGGNSAFYCTNATRGVFVNSKFRYSLTSNGLDADGTTNMYVYGCEASENYADGFNYHTTSYVVEESCVGYGNGWGLAGSNNGSSQHENNIIIRVDCTYRRNNGPQIADIVTADSWNVGVTASHPFGVTGWQSTGIYSEGNQWLHECNCHDCEYDIYEAGAQTTYTFDTTYTTSFGTLVPYSGAGVGSVAVPSGTNRVVNRLPGGTTGNFVSIDANDDIQDSGVAPASFEVPLTFGDSLNRSANTVTLDNDSASPGNLYYYGTNASGTKGWHLLPAGGDGGGSDMTVYSNIAGDFQVTFKDADELNIFGLPENINAVQIKRITRKPTGAAASVIKTRGTDLVCTWTPDALIPLAGVIATTSFGTLVTTDEYIIEIDGPPKGYHAATDSTKSMVTNALHYINDGSIASLTNDSVEILKPLLADGYNAFSLTATFTDAADNLKVMGTNDVDGTKHFYDITTLALGINQVTVSGAYQSAEPLMFQWVKFVIDGTTGSASVELTRFRK